LSTVNATVCPLCDDTGWKPVDDKGVRRVARCDCWRERIAKDRLGSSLIPPRYKHCTLESVRAYNDPLRKAVASATQFVDMFPSADRGLLLLGLAGVGKTHIAVGVLRAVIRKAAATGLFYHTPELLKTIRGSYDPTVRTSEVGVLKPVMEAELLVLDDLGAERPTDWVEEMMNLIVNTRYNERRLTIFTSNFPDTPDITEPNSLLGRIGFRMRSRLHEMCTIIEIDAHDFRDKDNLTNATDDDLRALWKLKPRDRNLPSPRGGRQARAQLREPAARDGKADLKWPGGRAGS
jgi:DNA replication protein DnaC